MVRQQQAVASYCIASWESFLSNSYHFYEIAVPIRSETSVFHIFRPFHNTLLSSMCDRITVVIVLYCRCTVCHRFYHSSTWPYKWIRMHRNPLRVGCIRKPPPLPLFFLFKKNRNFCLIKSWHYGNYQMVYLIKKQKNWRQIKNYLGLPEFS